MSGAAEAGGGGEWVQVMGYGDRMQDKHSYWYGGRGGGNPSRQAGVPYI